MPPARRVSRRLADAVEARRKKLGLNPSGFVEASGLTAPGLAPIRRGEIRDYQEATKLGVARALRWTPDSIDRLLAGQDPIELDPDEEPPPLVGQAPVDLPDELRAIRNEIAGVAAAVTALLGTVTEGAEQLVRGQGEILRQLADLQDHQDPSGGQPRPRRRR